MKDQELLWLYQQGERNFRRQDLSGQSFVGKNLSDADFSGADIRGTDFSKAILRGTNFTGVQAGLQRNEAILLLLFLIALAALLGACVGLVGTLLNLDLRAYTSSFEETAAGWASLLLLLVFALLSVLEGITTGFSVFALAFMIAVVVAALGPLVISFMVNPIIFAISSAVALAITIISSVTALTVLATTTAIAAFRAFELRAAVAVASVFVVVFLIIVITTNIVTSIVPVVPAVMLLSVYLGWRSMQGDPRQDIFLQIATALTARWGTSFREADLTRTNFAHAKLSNTNFEGATLAHIRWRSDMADEEILSHPQNL